jgi:hypothetical protein
MLTSTAMLGNLEPSQGEDENSLQGFSYRPVLSKLEGSIFLLTAVGIVGGRDAIFLDDVQCGLNPLKVWLCL